MNINKLNQDIMQFTQEDKKLLASKNITEEKIAEQLKNFETGFPYLKLEAAASVAKGILAPDENAVAVYEKCWENYKSEGKHILKFVPASGAASRMFKDLFAFVDAEYDVPTTAFEKKFFDEIRNFAFYGLLDEACRRNEGEGVEACVAAGKYKAVVRNLLLASGLNYGSLPKGLLKFHSYDGFVRTPLEEHLVEGALYAKGSTGKVNVHFTVSTEHKELFAALVAEKKAEYEAKYSTEYDVTFSEQKPSTDTIAADMDNNPFRDNGKLLFRPGGHGALIENLNDLDYDVIFIKNIDNVVPDSLKADTVKYKQVIAGVLVSLQEKVFSYLRRLENKDYTSEDLKMMLSFLENELFCHSDEAAGYDDEVLAAYLFRKFNRPMRVCGMVKNVGEPGGGPFLAYNQDGTVSLQILESSQVDMKDPAKKEMFEKGTHFNPVDLVCAVKNYKGEKFDLTKYVDKNTGFISYKSKSGKDLKALELPGLWNGAMSDWNTVFVEVPLSTFNPVKTVNDLLRPQHQK